MAEAKIVETVCEDRISDLPENLLETILLHVPVKNAIATMILSKRWRFIWMMLPRLEYDRFYDEDDNDDESKKSSWWVFEKSMELHKAPVLETLIFKLGPGCPSDADVGKWLAKAVDRDYGIDSPLPGDHDVVDTGRCLAIDTPALKVIHIVDYSGDSCSIENMPCLENAWIDVTSFPDTDKSKTSLSAVMSLVLFMTDQVLLPCSTVNFSRLIKLSICPHRLDWLEPLLLILENAPKLKDLLVNYEFTSDWIPLSWNQPSSIPRCLSSQLEIFEYREYADREDEEKFVTYILANSKCLKTATIFLRPDLGMKQVIIEELRDIPRVSTTSQLLLK